MGRMGEGVVGRMLGEHAACSTNAEGHFLMFSYMFRKALVAFHSSTLAR